MLQYTGRIQSSPSRAIISAPSSCRHAATGLLWLPAPGHDAFPVQGASEPCLQCCWCHCSIPGLATCHLVAMLQCTPPVLCCCAALLVLLIVAPSTPREVGHPLLQVAQGRAQLPLGPLAHCPLQQRGRVSREVLSMSERLRKVPLQPRSWVSEALRMSEGLHKVMPGSSAVEAGVSSEALRMSKGLRKVAPGSSAVGAGVSSEGLSMSQGLRKVEPGSSAVGAGVSSEGLSMSQGLHKVVSRCAQLLCSCCLSALSREPMQSICDRQNMP